MITLIAGPVGCGKSHILQPLISNCRGDYLSLNYDTGRHLIRVGGVERIELSGKFWLLPTVFIDGISSLPYFSDSEHRRALFEGVLAQRINLIYTFQTPHPRSGRGRIPIDMVHTATTIWEYDSFAGFICTKRGPDIPDRQEDQFFSSLYDTPPENIDQDWYIRNLWERL